MCSNSGNSANRLFHHHQFPPSTYELLRPAKTHTPKLKMHNFAHLHILPIHPKPPSMVYRLGLSPCNNAAYSGDVAACVIFCGYPYYNTPARVCVRLCGNFAPASMCRALPTILPPLFLSRLCKRSLSLHAPCTACVAPCAALYASVGQTHVKEFPGACRALWRYCAAGCAYCVTLHTCTA